MNLLAPTRLPQRRWLHLGLSLGDSVGKASSKKQARRQCIFCGAEGLTGEHFLPQWMHELLFLDGDFNGHHGIAADVHIAHGKAAPTEVVHKKYAGPPWTRTYKVVCAKCNGGWMSEIENAVRGPLGALILGNPCATLSPIDQVNVAKWFVLKTIVSEHGQPESARIEIPNDVREVFRTERGNPPPNWWIHLGKCEGPREIQSISHASVHQEDGVRYQTYSSSLAIGKVFLQAYGVVNAPGDLPLELRSPFTDKMVLIHPPQGTTIVFDDLQEMSRIEYERVATFSTRLLAQQVDGFPTVRRLHDYKAPRNIGRLKRPTSR